MMGMLPHHYIDANLSKIHSLFLTLLTLLALSIAPKRKAAVTGMNDIILMQFQ